MVWVDASQPPAMKWPRKYGTGVLREVLVKCCAYIPGTMNGKADALSRKHYPDHEWMLNYDMFSRLCKIFPGLTIDLFASILNHRLPRYVSWGPDS